MDIRSYLDSTYLKTAEQAGVSETENIKIVCDFVQEALDENFKLIMIRPNHVIRAKEMILKNNSKVLVGTVIDFPQGNSDVKDKVLEAQQAIKDGADELDFVCNYEAFKKGNLDLVNDEIIRCTRLGLDANKVVKWIIEVAALTDTQIEELSLLIKKCIVLNFDSSCYNSVFVKSSTGFYLTQDNKPNGATVAAIKIMLSASFPLPVKAAGGVRSYSEAVEMIELGVMRIGTSGAKALANGLNSSLGY
jgi:deoxyribose-phosphate aldolase